MAFGPWVDAPDLTVFFGFEAGWQRQGIWRWQSTPLWSSAPLTPGGLFAGAPFESSVQLNGFLTGAQSWYRLTASASSEYRTEGHLRLFQFGSDTPDRPTDFTWVPPEWEWPPGAVGVDVEGPVTYLDDFSTVSLTWSVVGEVQAQSSVTMPVSGYVLEAVGKPLIGPGNVASLKPDVGEIASYAVRDQVHAGVATPGALVSQSRSTSFTTQAWPITLMVVSNAGYSGGFPHTGALMPGSLELNTTASPVVASARYRPPRYRFVYPGGGMWRTRQRQSRTGADSWSLRQRQSGGARGSWPARQRQRGL